MKTFCTFLALLALLALQACGGGEEESTQCIGGVVYDANGTPKAIERAGQVSRLQAC